MAGGDERVFKVIFLNQGKVYELFARNVSQGGLFGFVEVEGLLFGERSKLIVDANEEGLRTEFEGVKRLYVPMHAVVRIDEVEKAGPARATTPDRSAEKVTVLPMPLPGQSAGTPKS